MIVPACGDRSATADLHMLRLLCKAWDGKTSASDARDLCKFSNMAANLDEFSMMLWSWQESNLKRSPGRAEAESLKTYKLTFKCNENL